MLPSSWQGTKALSTKGRPQMSASLMVPGPALVMMTSGHSGWEVGQRAAGADQAASSATLKPYVVAAEDRLAMQGCGSRGAARELRHVTTR